MKTPKFRLVVASLSAVLAALGISLSVVLTSDGSNLFTVTLGGPHGTPTVSVSIPDAAVEQAGDLADHDSSRSEQPAGVSAVQLDLAREQQERLAASDQLPVVTPDAAPVQRGCTTRLVRNYSSRRGVRPRELVAHYTVSANRPGWSDVYAVAGLFDTASFQASSNYIIDAEGHCLYIVRESDKAWTQAAANPVAISVEVINSGHEPSYAGSAGLAKLGLVFHDAAKRWAIPLQIGAVSGCAVARPGIVDHGMLGACGGGHHDIAPYKIGPVLAAAKAFDPPAGPVPCTVRALQRKLGLRVDGVVGPKVRSAIRVFQRKRGWRVTGMAGKRVGAALGLIGCAV